MWFQLWVQMLVDVWPLHLNAQGWKVPKVQKYLAALAFENPAEKGAF